MTKSEKSVKYNVDMFLCSLLYWRSLFLCASIFCKAEVYCFLRIISGVCRGCRLISVKSDKTRPTSDRVKESLFNIIQARVYGAAVLDLFAGSGALGLEALSRGAASVDFVDCSASAVTAVYKNINKTKLQNARVFKKDYALFLKTCGVYDIIFLDPPYNKGFLKPALEAVAVGGLLASNGIVVCEGDKNGEIESLCTPGTEIAEFLIFENKPVAGMHRCKSVAYGKTVLSFFTMD